MASAGAEFEDQINDWMDAFKALPEERQENLRKWFATQKVIIDNSGLTPEAWFGYVETAMQNPFDYSFIHDFPERSEHDAGRDAAERSDSTQGARDLIAGGKADPRTAPDGPGIQEKAKSEQSLERELFSNFMKGRLGAK